MITHMEDVLKCHFDAYLSLRLVARHICILNCCVVSYGTRKRHSYFRDGLRSVLLHGGALPWGGGGGSKGGAKPGGAFWVRKSPNAPFLNSQARLQKLRNCAAFFPRRSFSRCSAFLELVGIACKKIENIIMQQQHKLISFSSTTLISLAFHV
jgi:hypothetical protein